MKNVLILSGLLALVPLRSFSQSSDIRVVVPPEVEAMVAEHVRINQANGVVAGYRVQVYGNAVLSRSRDVKANVEMSFPDLEVQVVLEEPDFKVVIGNYQDRFEAYGDLQRVLPQFPGAFLVRQLIPISEL